MQTVKAIIGSSALAILMAASPAMADSRNNKLKGDFAFSGSATCVQSSGFSDDLTPTGPASVFSFSILGVRTFNSNGTGSAKFRTVSVGHPGPAVAIDSSANFTYDVDADGMINIQQGDINGVVVDGPNVGQRQRITNVPLFVGFLSPDRNSLVLATYNPGVETIFRLDPSGTVVLGQNQRICHRARSAIRISQKPGSGGKDD